MVLYRRLSRDDVASDLEPGSFIGVVAKGRPAVKRLEEKALQDYRANQCRRSR